jgi:hypothetical protein
VQQLALSSYEFVPPHGRECEGGGEIQNHWRGELKLDAHWGNVRTRVFTTFAVSSIRA